MEIWLLKLAVDKYNSFNGYEVEKELNINFIGSSVVERWKTPLITSYYKKRKIADASDFSTGAPLFNENAVESLRGCLNGNVELLPAYYENVKYYVVNIVNVIDALDYEISEFERFDTGAIMYCTKYSFKPENVETQHIFKIPLCNSIDIFVSNQFKKRVEETGLKGFIFVEVWNSEEDSTKAEDIKAEPMNLELRGENFKEKEKEVYPDISEEEAKILRAKIIVNLFDIVLQHIKEIGKEKGMIDSIGLEYFFDGQSTDIGVRINLLLNLTEDEYDESYFKLLNHPNIKSDFNSLYIHCVKDYMNEEETSVFFGVIQEIILKLNEKIQNTLWRSITEVTRDFSIKAPELYD